MGALERITVTMSNEMASTVREAVDSGDYASTSEIVREALREWMRNRRADANRMVQLRDLVREGDASGTDIPAEEVFAELRAIVAAARAAKA